MKKIFFVILVLIISHRIVQAQFIPEKTTSKSSNNLLFGFINPKNFTMNHSFQVSMISTSYGNVSLTSYINSMSYRINNRLNISADVKMQYSPYASSSFGKEYSNNLQNYLSGIYLSRADLNYRISDNSFLSIQYRRIDESDYYNNNFYNPFHNDWR